MRKMGNFKGYPVYLVDKEFWDKADTVHNNALYVVEGQVFFHDIYLGKVDRYKNLVEFNEDRFNALCKKNWNEDSARAMACVTDFAETRPQEEEKPVNEYSDSTAAVDEFMATWNVYIDNELVKMKAEIAKMGVEFNEAG